MLEVVGALGVADDVLGAVGGVVALGVGVVALDVVGGLGAGVVTLFIINCYIKILMISFVAKQL